MSRDEQTPPPESRAARTRRPWSLRNKLFLFATALVVVPGLLFASSAERSSHASLERLIGRQLGREAGHTARELVTTLRGERQTLRSFARQDLMREIRVADIDKRVSAALRTLAEGASARFEYRVIDRERQAIASSDPAVIGTDLRWPELADRAFAGSEPVLGPRPARPGEAPRLWMATPIPDPDSGDASIGVLLGVYDWNALTGVTASVQRELADQGFPTEVLVVQRDGATIGGTGGGRGRRAAPVELARRLASEPPGYFHDEASDLLIGHAPLGDEDFDWHVLIAEPRETALAPARELRRKLGGVLAVTLAAALAIAAFAARRVVRPLSELTAAIRGVSSGQSAALEVPVRSEDEVGVLANAFNDMASELDRAQHDLAEAAKFAFVGELAGGVAHEVRTSLGVLRSSAQIFERSVHDGDHEQAGELAEMMRDEVDRLGRFVDDLASLARPRAIQLEETPLSVPVFRAADFAEPQASEKGIAIERVAPDAEVRVSCDTELIHQVALNLIVNAIQALPDGGRIEVRILGNDGDGPGFEVCDDGPGISDELRERIFLPFVTGREKGIGLGLTFVKRVVFEHGGQVVLEPRTPGGGTCFRVELRSVEEAA